MKTTQCPSCGAPITIRAADSVYVICEFCRSTLLRDEDHLKNLGKMADLMDDPSLIQIGTEGRYNGQHFGVIGRIQLRYEAGLWNEWHILFDEGKSAWLSEASGEITISALNPTTEPLPAFEDLKPEARLELGKATFMVTSLQSAQCISGAGELPFKVENGYTAPSADLREVDGKQRFATIDYSETPPLLFIGKTVTFESLKLSGLKEQPDQSKAALSDFKCPKCGASLSVHSAEIERIICPNCRSFLDIQNNQVKLLQKALTGKKISPTIPLGSQGRFEDIDWEIIGFMQRTTKPSDPDYTWSEYLLFNQSDGFAWLTEYQGHWNFARTLVNPPSVPQQQPTFKHLGNTYTLFASDRATVTYVLGEFYWQVGKGETVLLEDYISPPLMLSREVSGKEVSWSLAQYVEPEALYQAFNIKTSPVPRRVVFSNQPNPFQKTSKGIFLSTLIFLAIATAIQLYFALAKSPQTMQTQVISIAEGESQYVLPVFSLTQRTPMLRVRHQALLDNNWADLTSTLVNQETGEFEQGTLAMAYYHGIDDGESWQEGSRQDALSFRNVPPGNYYLIIDAQTQSPDTQGATPSLQSPTGPVVDTITVTSNPATSSNYILAIIGLFIIPIVSFFRKIAFEGKRWNESDFSPSGYLQSDADEGDDDDDEDE